MYVARVRGAVGLRLTLSGSAVPWDDADEHSVLECVSSESGAVVVAAGVHTAIRWLGTWGLVPGSHGTESMVSLPVDVGVERVPGGTALGVRAAYPRVRTAPLPGDVLISWQSALRADFGHHPGLSAEVSAIHVADDHVRLTVDGHEQVFRWSASERFDADRVAQRAVRL